LIENGSSELSALKSCCLILDKLTQQDDLESSVKLHNPNVVVLDMRQFSPVVLETLKNIQLLNPVPIVIFSEDDASKSIQLAVEAGVMAYIVDSLNTSRIKPILETAIARFNHCQKIKDELLQTKTELSDRKDIDKAKGILMDRKQLSEADAYKLLRKTAMQQNIKLVEIARNINSTADLLSL